MNILITGCNGQLGNEMRVLSAQHPRHNYFFTDVAELDITNRQAVSSFVTENAIDLIVNCAAYTNVDKAEEDEATALKINADALAVLGSQGIRVIHISTDYVFSGDEHIPAARPIRLLPVLPTGARSWKERNVFSPFVRRRSFSALPGCTRPSEITSSRP